LGILSKTCLNVDSDQAKTNHLAFSVLFHLQKLPISHYFP